MTATLVVEGECGTAVRTTPPPGVIAAWRFYFTGETPARTHGHLQISRFGGRTHLLARRGPASPTRYADGIVIDLRDIHESTATDMARHLARNVVRGTLPLETTPEVVKGWERGVYGVLVLLERFPLLSLVAREGTGCPEWLSGGCSCQTHCLERT
jgi:hypothetical protein